VCGRANSGLCTGGWPAYPVPGSPAVGPALTSTPGTTEWCLEACDMLARRCGPIFLEVAYCADMQPFPGDAVCVDGFVSYPGCAMQEGMYATECPMFL